ncbi:hypothetical protein CJF31_00008226 [Rutstroemia sp. NJR-2017a BVV2]|nr:hypothetical protein CJF31_00008226 [Rutstroemia sp. NJR-2017a BVV2]
MPRRSTSKSRESDNIFITSPTSASQESVDFELMKTVKEMSIATKKRREAKRNKIENERIRRVQDIKVRLDGLFESHRSRKMKLQQAQWAKLSSLNKKRQDLEAQILASMTAVERHTMNMARELDAMFVGRLAGLKELQEKDA